MSYKNLYLDIVTKSGKHRTVHAGVVAGNIERKFPGLRSEPDFEAMQDRLFDYTNACDREEQRGWMAHYMYEALKEEKRAYQLQTCGPEYWNSAAGILHEAATLFLAAYDMIAD